MASDRTGRSGAQDRLKEAERLRPRVLAWRDALNQSLGANAPAAFDWNESLDTPHFAGRPGWDGFGSLVLWAAYTEHPALRRPPTLPEQWDYDAALMRSNAEGFRSRYSHLVRKVELWLPAAFPFTFEAEDIDGRRVVVGSAETLQRQLADLNNATWKVDDDEVAAWSRRAPLTDAPLEILARYAFSILSALARAAVDHRLPMKLDT
ncbi:MAG TPA: hypothetical protein VMI56_03380 [Reyranella sp.]|nr:hypothetical protein [Reyranella sp.]